MMLPIAHAGHWLMGVGFAGPPLMMIGGLIFIAARERRREGSAGD